MYGRGGVAPPSVTAASANVSHLISVPSSLLAAAGRDRAIKGGDFRRVYVSMCVVGGEGVI